MTRIEPGTLIGGRFRVLEMLPGRESGDSFNAQNVTDGSLVVMRLVVESRTPLDASRVLSEIPPSLRAESQLFVPLGDLFVAAIGERFGVFVTRAFAPGRSLLSLVTEKGPLNAHDAQVLFSQLLEILVDFEQMAPPLLHGNIHPGNVILTETGRLVLVDFALPRVLACSLVEDELDLSPWSRSVNAGYAAPELLLGKPNTRSDLYGAGATFLFAVTGRAPQALLRASADSLLHVLEKEGCSTRLASVAKRALELHTAMRYAGASEALEALRSRQAAPSPGKRPEEQVDWQVEPLPDARTRWAFWGLLACLGVASPLLLASFLAFLHRPSGEEALSAVLRVSLGVLGLLAVARHLQVNLPRFLRPASYRLAALPEELRVVDRGEILHAPWRSLARTSRIGPVGIVEAWWTEAHANVGDRRTFLLYPVYRLSLPEILERIEAQGRRWRLPLPPSRATPRAMLRPGPLGVLVVGALLLMAAVTMAFRPDRALLEWVSGEGPRRAQERTWSDQELAVAFASGAGRTDGLDPERASALARALIPWRQAVAERIRKREGVFPESFPSQERSVDTWKDPCPAGMESRTLSPEETLPPACTDVYGPMLRVQAPEGRTPFLVDWTEVSVAAHARCVAAGYCPPAGTSTGCVTGLVGHDQHPVNCLNRAASAYYCEWAHRRLCSAEEWRAAAGSATHPWGEEPPDCSRAVISGKGPEREGPGCGLGESAPVGSRPLGASPNGAVDLVGNVAEWVSDPAGLVCGGGFDTSRLEEMGRPGTRAVFPDAVSPSIGFRCCRDPI